MSTRLRASLFIAGAFVLLSAGDCDFASLGEILDKPGRILVTNVGTEPAVVAIIADDVKSYPTLAAGATASVATNVGGRYQVRVVMTPENTQAYRQNLLSLRGQVEKLIDGSLSSAEKTQLFLQLAGIKAAIQALEMANAAGCSGSIRLERDTPETAVATVRWVAQNDSGFWDSTCGSS